MLSIVPENTGVSKNGGVLSGTSLNDMSGENFGLQKCGGKDVDCKNTKSEKSNGGKKSPKKAKGIDEIHKIRDKVGTAFVSDGKEKESGSVSSSRAKSLLKDSAKVGLGLGVGALGLKVVQVGINNGKGENKQGTSEDTGYSEDIKNAEKDEALARGKAANEALPEKSRAWLFWFWSYLFKHLGILGEGERGVGLFAEHDKGSKITMLVFNAILALISLLVVVCVIKSEGVKWPCLFVPGVIVSPLITFLPAFITCLVYSSKKDEERKRKKKKKSKKEILVSTNNIVN